MVSKAKLNARGGERGMAMVLVILFGVALIALSAISLQLSLVHSVTESTEVQAFMATQIRDSGAAKAIVMIKEGGAMTPVSGSGTTPAWVDFSDGAYYFYTTADPTEGLSTIRTWGKFQAGPNPSSCTSSPDATSWDGSGWMVKGVEITIKGEKSIPEAPLYFGNGGVEQPLGGFSWASGVDPADPFTWIPILSGPASYQSSSVPFEPSSLDHPFDFLYNGGSPAPASANPHPYSLWVTQNLIGQFNILAWFANSAGSGSDPTSKLTPAPTSAYYDMTDPMSPDYPYPVLPNTPDVQDFAFQLWNSYGSDPAATKLGSGSWTGTYGNLSQPGVTFVTGRLQVPAGQSFKGCGVLVIRDDFDPNTQTDNMPSIKAELEVEGTFEWTGLVIIAGWAPEIFVSDTAGANATIVGALFGEDSVQSGGEISLDSATIITRIENTFRVLYSNALFRPGGLVHQYLPMVSKEIVGIRDL